MDGPEELLRALGVDDDTLDAEERRFLDENGFLCLRDLISPGLAAELVDRVASHFADRGGPPALHGTLHADGLLTERPSFAIWSHPRVLAAVAQVLGPDFRAVDLAYRAPTPGYGEQTLHIDWSGVPVGQKAPVCTVIFPLVDFDDRNGATRVVPGSHRCGKKPKHSSPAEVHPGETRLLGPAGSAFVLNGLIWHSGTRNEGGAPRHSLSASFRASDVQLFDKGPRVLPDWLSPAAAKLVER